MRIKNLTLEEMKIINDIFDGTSKIKILPKEKKENDKNDGRKNR